MATKTKAQIATLVLESLGVKAAGVAASAEDSERVEDAIDSVHDQLRARGLAPFELATVPEWAQEPLADYVAGSLSMLNVFRVSGERAGLLRQARQEGYRILLEQNQVQDPGIPAKPYWF